MVRFARYWEKFDVEIDPGLEPDADAIADALVEAMRAAYEERKDCNVIAHTIRLGADLWREYAIRFDPESGEIGVRVGQLVNTGQVPYTGTEPDGAVEVVRQVGVPMVHTYSDVYKVNIFSGPTFRFAREGNDLVVRFLYSHHRSTHSLVLALGVGVILGALLALFAGPMNGLWGGILTWLGFSGHILEDQMGHMGSNLFWPFTRKRIPGPGLIHAGDAIPNFLTVWTSLVLILFNLDRFSAQPILPQTTYLVLGIGLPWLVLGGTYTLRKMRSRVAALSDEAMRQAERIAEVEKTELV